MRNLPFVCMVIGVPYVLNAVAIVHLSRKISESERSRPHIPPPVGQRPPNVSGLKGPCNPAGEDVPPTQLLREIRQLRADVMSRNLALGASPQVEAPVAFTGDPEVAHALESQDRLDRLWEEMTSLARVKDEVGLEKCRALMLQSTSAYLGFDKPTAEAFQATLIQVLESLRRARERLQEKVERLRVSDPKEERVRLRRLATSEYEQEHAASLHQLSRFLNASPRHRAWASDLTLWVRFVDEVARPE